MGLIHHESSKMNFYCERADQTLIVWPKSFGKVNGIQRLEESSVGIYAPIEVTGDIYKVSLWPLEVLTHIQTFVSEVNPHTRKYYALFNMRCEMPKFLASEHYKALQLGVCVTEGQLMTAAFKPPSGIYNVECTELSVNCHPEMGEDLCKSLLDKTGDMKSGDLRVKICIQKEQWWELTVHVLFDNSDFKEVTALLIKNNLVWKESVLKLVVQCQNQDNKWVKKINNGLANKYCLTGELSTLRYDAHESMPNVLRAFVLQAPNYGFVNVTMIGIPLPCIWPPISDIFFAAFLQTDEYWEFLNGSQDVRNMDLYEVYGVVISSLLSKSVDDKI